MSSLLVLSSSFLVPITVQAADEEAAGSWYNQSYADWYTKVYDDQNPSEIFGERYTAAQVQWIVYGLISVPLNFLTKYNQKGWTCLISMTGGNISSAADCAAEIGGIISDASAVWTTAMGISQNNQQSILAQRLDPKSFSGIGYLYNIGSKLSLIPTASAQGFGYSALNPIQDYWSGARDIAYALTVLFVIIFAFMIMFRVKLSPQLVISVQSALPKVIIGIILVTFSYAISGFMIDLMYLCGGIIALLIKTAGFSSNEVTDIYRYIIPSMTSVGGLWILLYMIGYFVMFLVAILLGIISLALSSVTLLNALVSTILSVVMIVMLLWCLILVFWYAIKIPWVLIKNLISIYVSIIFSPIQFMVGTLYPQAGFGMWFRKLFAELLVFPLTGAAFYIAYKMLLQSMIFSIGSAGSNFLGLTDIVNSAYQAIYGGGAVFSSVIWVPSIVGTGDIVAGFLFLIASFGIIIGIPKLPELLKSIIMGAKFDYGTAIGEAMAPVDWAKKSAPYRAISDINQAEGAANILGSKIPMYIARKFGKEDNLEQIVAKMREQIVRTR